MDIEGGMNSTMIDQIRMCGFRVTDVTNIKLLIFDFFFIFFGSKICHLCLHHLGQPRIVSEFLVGLLAGNVFRLEGPVIYAFRELEFITSSVYMFALGLEMNPLSLLHSPGPKGSVAYAGILSTTAFSVLTFILFRNHTDGFGAAPSSEPRVLSILTVMYAASSSPIITRLITDLKLNKSKVGQLAIQASLTNDMVCTLVMCVLLALRDSGGNTSVSDVMRTAGYVLVEILVVLLIVRPALKWINSRNPEGQPINRIHMVVVIAVTQGLCYASNLFDYDSKVNAFLIGLALPSEGRVSNFLIKKINYIQTTFSLPLYFPMANLQFNNEMWDKVADKHGMRRYGTAWTNIVYIVLVSTIGKLSGTLAAAKYFGLRWLEAVALGVLMNIKGYLHIFFAFHCSRHFFMGEKAALVMMVAVLFSIVFGASMVSLIASHIRPKEEPTQPLMGMQWHNPATKLNITIVLRGPQDVPSAANVVETLRGAATTGLAVDAVDMIDMIEVDSASLVRLRQQIGNALDAHIGAGSRGQGHLTRTLAEKPLSFLPEEICRAAHEHSAVLIVIPMDFSDPGFRRVNQKILNEASSSVGILIDRGLGWTNSTSLSTAKLRVAALFTGGSDDHEVLALAGCMAKHESVDVTAVRLLPDKNAIAMEDTVGTSIFNVVTDQEEALKVADNHFTAFYDRHIATGEVSYLEMFVLDGPDTVVRLKGMAGKYDLIIVGQGHEKDMILTAGMRDREQFPELGPTGNALASSRFSASASILVIQQSDHGRRFHVD